MSETTGPKPTKIYLGDGVYAEDNGYEIVLTTENGISIQNRIVLEPAVMAALHRFYTRNQPKAG